MHKKLPLNRINNSLNSDWTLTTPEAEARRKQYGNNDIVETHINVWKELLTDTAKDPMIWFLVGASILYAILKDYEQTLVLLLATIPLIGMDVFLHWRTRTSTQGLRKSLATNAKVLRDNVEIILPTREIVPGDLIIVPAGNFFPADGIILQGTGLQVDESMLTGESFPVKKEILTAIAEESAEPFVDDKHWVYAGTRLLTNTALMRAIYTGAETLYGEIVISAISESHSITPMQKAIGKLIFNLIIIAVVLCFILGVVRYLQGFGIIDTLLSAATLAVAALPDEVPLVFTFYLGLGVFRLARKKALVRRGVSVENIGRVTTICSDKTGTITEGNFKLHHTLSGNGTNPSHLIYLASIASRTETGDPLDLAIISEQHQLQRDLPESLITFPFTEDRKRETGIIEIIGPNINITKNNYQVVTKGLPEVILSLTTLSSEEKKLWLNTVSDLAKEGFKIIACADLNFTFDTDNNEKPKFYEPTSGYQFKGLLIFSDPPRAGVKEAIQRCLESKIHVLMITGDHPETARSVAKSIGLGRGNPKVILASDCEIEMRNQDGHFFEWIDVVARALPSQKLAIVTALQKHDEIVAATGDGVNDVPALKAADIGIAMGEKGTQSAREVADIILLDDNFTSIVNAIAEGRQLFSNLKLSFKYLLLIHIPFVISAAFIPLLGYPLLYYPIHIVWIELFIHPTAMLAFQNVATQQRLEPASKSKAIQFFNAADWKGLFITGTFSTTVLILSYILFMRYTHDEAHARTFAMTLLGFTSAVCTIGLTGIQQRMPRIIFLATLLFSILLPQLTIFSGITLFVPLNVYDWLMIVGISGITFLLTKWLCR